ncbi:rRNA processing protein [Grosmannia clavigera kw1407]|uniref:Pre-rRNA-processing protein n=1 Tax=Grosmannia clavigera (strain kw1407 / UAMH 11150) TaxID=655863 RepID=F0XTB5_GROCL|nr:rRNA processing protein [Grosmannia clavigera kw1407]EFW99370.1 rRNA processing protein [Grosmannia clavigera kw1407]
MGSSTRKKNEKKKDFQKTKLKVGKARAKPTNFTDTSFRSKSIVVNQQSLSETAPEAAVQFRHNLSLAASSRSDNQRRDALAYLTSQISGGMNDRNSGNGSGSTSHNPVGTVGVLSKLLPLISDPAAPVRTQLLKLFRALPPDEVRPMAAKILLYVRAGITNLSSAVRDDALSTLEWLLEVAGEDLVSSPGGWLKTLNGFGAMMGWVAPPPPGSAGAGGVGSGWSSAPKSSFAAIATKSGSSSGGRRLATGGQAYARQIAALAKFLEIGLRREQPSPYDPKVLWDSLYRPPAATATIAKTNPFGHLNIFGAPRDEDSEMYADREDRQRVFAKRWQPTITTGVEEARKEGGAVGRAAATLRDVLETGMSDYDSTTIS